MPELQSGRGSPWRPSCRPHYHTFTAAHEHAHARAHTHTTTAAAAAAATTTATTTTVGRKLDGQHNSPRPSHQKLEHRRRGGGQHTHPH